MKHQKNDKEVENVSRNEKIAIREHAEFYNCFTIQSIKNDIAFLKAVYQKDIGIDFSDINKGFVNRMKIIAKDIYFFIDGVETHITPQSYIKRKYEFIQNKIPNGDANLFYLAWNGLIKNDSFKRLLLKKFSLKIFNDELCPQNIPAIGSSLTRYRTKFIIADDMATDSSNKRRTTGRVLDDGSGFKMKEGIVWLPNGKAIPLFPQAYVPLNKTQVILIRHGKSIHESGGDNPEFVGSGYWDSWKDNRRISGAIGNSLKPQGIETARELGKDFKVAVDILTEKGYPLWSWSKEIPIHVFGSESENTEQTALYFLKEAGYTNISFNAIYGINSQKYGALTHKFKKDIIGEMVKIYGKSLNLDDAAMKVRAKAMLKNRFYHYPEGETLIEADWRIAFSFVDMLNKNQGKRIMLADHSGAIRVFKAIIKTLDFADYSTLKESQDSILAFNYQPGRNLRYDWLQKTEFKLRK